MPRFNIFNTVKMPDVESSNFDLSHTIKGSGQLGHLTPILSQEVLPGDTWNPANEIMIRFAPMVSPAMVECRVDVHYFFVPNRLLWPGWENFITDNADAEAHPYIQFPDGGTGPGLLYDYLGYPLDVPATLKFNPFPVAAYYKIWDEYFRDQNLAAEKFVPLSSGSNTSAYSEFYLNYPQARAYMHDYFTAALPFAQKGDDVLIPLVSSQDIPVQLKTGGFNQMYVKSQASGSLQTGDVIASAITPAAGGVLNVDGGASVLDPNGNLVVDVQENATDINTLRRAFRLQEWLERQARGGSRYIEQIWSHFKVKSSDARLQRPEFLGMTSGRVAISEVLSTVENTDASLPLGTLGGHGISYNAGRIKTFTAEEHGWLMAIMSLLPETGYMNGCHRSLFKQDLFDYAFPTFAHLGEQGIYNKEIFLSSTQPVNDTTNGTEFIWGYIPRYADYKHVNNRVTGYLRTDLAYWHSFRDFSELPPLNEDFIYTEPGDFDKLFAVDTETSGFHFVFNVKHHLPVRRRLPKFGTPKL